MRVLFAYVRQRDADAGMDRNRRRSCDWADLAGRCDVQLGPRDQRGNEGRDIAECG
jgi:hypothetical protein